MGWVEEKTEGVEMDLTLKTNGEMGPQMDTVFCLGRFLIILKGCLYGKHLKEAEINDEEEKVPLGGDQGRRDPGHTGGGTALSL